VEFPSNITMRDLARAAGVAPSTVSKALRDDPSIPSQRCVEIKELAERLGYKPNPMVSALMAQLHRQRRRSDPYHIAWLDFWNANEPPIPISKPLLDGARECAKELGYNIEVHRVAADQTSLDRLRRILLTRGQWGIIIPPVPKSAMYLSLDLRGLTGVTIGTSLHQPVMHRVAPNHFQGTQLAMDHLQEKGFRRIGLVLSPAKHQRVEGKWLGAYLARQYESPAGEHIPPLFATESNKAAFTKWLQQYKPDAIMLGEEHILDWIKGTARSKTKRPAIACLAREITEDKVAGIDCQPKGIGAAAVKMLISQIHRNERGTPSEPHTVFLDGVWVDQ